MPQEEILKHQEQAAARAEGPGPGDGPYRGFDFFMQYLLHRLDSMEANLRGEIKQLDAKVEAVEANLNTRIDRVETGLRGEIKQVENKVDKLHGEIHWFIGLAVAAIGVAATVLAWLK